MCPTKCDENKNKTAMIQNDTLTVTMTAPNTQQF